MIVVFVGFLCIFLLGILIFKRLTVQYLYKSFSVKGLTIVSTITTAKSMGKLQTG
jgi:hypothetical protein